MQWMRWLRTPTEAYLTSLGRTGEHLMTCLKLAKTIPIFSAERAWGYERFEEQAMLLERHCRQKPD